MCSVNEDEDFEMVRVEERILTDRDICRKCKKSAAELSLREKDFYCMPCFSIYFVHKFRSTIGKSKEIKPGDRILIGFSGGINSTSLLHLIHNGLQDESPKRLRFDPVVFFIDETSVNPASVPIKSICVETSTFNNSFFCTSFEEVFKDQSSEISIYSLQELQAILASQESLPKNQCLNEELKNLMSLHLMSKTSREELICQLRSELICRCAKQLCFTKVFLGCNGTSLAVKILSDVALGRGSQLADHVNFKGTQFGVEIFRPMRELLENEVKFYVKGHNILIAADDRDPLMKEKEQSIVSCSRNFIYNLHKDFLSTVPTILRTGGKLANGSSCNDSESTTISGSPLVDVDESACARGEGEETCLFCGYRKDFSDNPISAVEAVKMSKLLSATQPPRNGCENSEDALGGSLDKKDSKDLVLEADIYKYFCYGCANLCKEMGNINNYPPRVREKIKEILRQEQARRLIQDCLI